MVVDGKKYSNANKDFDLISIIHPHIELFEIRHVDPGNWNFTRTYKVKIQIFLEFRTANRTTTNTDK